MTDLEELVMKEFLLKEEIKDVRDLIKKIREQNSKQLSMTFAMRKVAEVKKA